MWRCLVLLLAACGRLGFEYGDPIMCPDRYVALDGGCYRTVLRSEEALTWADAERACEADMPAAHLAVIDDSRELEAVLTHVGPNDLWIGISDRITEGTFLTVTGEVPRFLLWRSGEPPAEQDCGEIDPAGLSAAPCDNLDDYICEYDGATADPTAF